MIRYAAILITMLSVIAIACNKPAGHLSKNKTDNKKSEMITHEEETNSEDKIKSFAISDEVVLSQVMKSEDEWKSDLNEIEYYVIREKGTERAFTGEYWDNKLEGIYVCNACKMPLYDSQTKFKSGTGWPSYYAPIDQSYILEDTDYNLGYARTEIMCGRCEGHLGHVFNDGPQPTGKRHCVNSASLKFVPESEVEEFILHLKE